MLLQRLTKDDTVGFNYDYMGAAEYEFGATRNGRAALAQAFVDKQFFARPLVFREVIGQNVMPAIGVVAMGSKEMLDALEADGGRISVTKEAFRTGDTNIVAWMAVAWESYRAKPLLLVRRSLGGKDLTNRTKKFLDPFIEAIEQEAKESVDA